MKKPGTSSSPTTFKMNSEYMLSERYAEIAKLINALKNSKGVDLKSYSTKDRRLNHCIGKITF